MNFNQSHVGEVYHVVYQVLTWELIVVSPVNYLQRYYKLYYNFTNAILSYTLE